jgi:hypothetical protein
MSNRRLPEIVWTAGERRLAIQRYPAEYTSWPMTDAAERYADQLCRERQLHEALDVIAVATDDAWPRRRAEAIQALASASGETFWKAAEAITQQEA